MGGKTEQQIRDEREAIELWCTSTYPGCEIIDSMIEDVPPSKNRPLTFLAKSLELLADADIAVFADGWGDARGCRIEHTAATDYGITTIEFSRDLKGKITTQ